MTLRYSTTKSQLVSITGPVTVTDNGGSLTVDGTFWPGTQPVSAASLPLPSGAATEASLASVDGKLPALVEGRVPVVFPAGGGGLTDAELRATPIAVAVTALPGGAGLTDTELRATPVPVSGAFYPATQPVSLASAPITPVIGTFWQATQPVSGPVTDAQLRAAAVPVSLASAPTTPVTGTFWPATQPVSGTFWQATQPVSAVALPLPTGAATEATLAAIGIKTPALGQATMLTSQPVVIASNQSAVPVSMAAASVLFKGRASTFNTPGRAGTTGQKILSLHNATGSAVTVTVATVTVDLACTVVKAVTVAPPIVRLWKVTGLPTNGTALTKNKIGGTTTSSASVTVLGDASADNVGAALTLTAVLPAGAIVTQEYAPRLITAAGQEAADRMELLGDTTITLGALEGVVVSLDYVLATQNPITDRWIASIEWSET